VIRLEKLCKHYGAGDAAIRAVDEVSLQVAANEFVVITGPSGAGKTTLLNLIAGLTRPDQGEVRVAGQDILSLSDAELSRFRARTIGFVFQFQSMMPTLDVLDNVLLPLRFVPGGGSGEVEALALSLLEDMGLGSRAHAFAHELSEGQKRRVCIARALINEPSLLICDEPTGDLDPETEAAIMEVISQARENGATVLMATHNLELREYATISLLIEEGRVTSG